MPGLKMFSIVNELFINSFKYVINYVSFIYRYLLSFFNSVLVKGEFVIGRKLRQFPCRRYRDNRRS